MPLNLPGGAAALRAWRDTDPTVTGICAYNDEVAIAVLGAAQRYGLDIPRDLAVIGADNIPIAAVTVPALTTVQPDTAAVSRQIADTIVRKLHGRSAPRWPHSDLYTVIRRDSA